MDTSAADSSLEAVYPANNPPSPTPISRPNLILPTTPKDGGMSNNLSFRPPPRPGSSLRKGRKSDFNSPAPPPLPQSVSADHGPRSDTTNLEGISFYPASGSSSPSRPSSSSSIGGSLFNPAPASDGVEALNATRHCRQKLQSLRQENQNQVNSAGLLGQGLLEVRNRIESLMDQLADELKLAEEQTQDDGETVTKTNARIKELSETIEAEMHDIEIQKKKLYADVMSYSAHPIDHDMIHVTESPSKASRVASAIKSLTSTTPNKNGTGINTVAATAATTTTPRQGDRRIRNAAARQTRADSELVNEIQAGLVQEVRRLQGLLKERDDQRGALERAHTELEKQLDQYKPKIIQMTETEDALKQENWDLNVAKQTLEEQLSERANILKKAELENLRLTKDLSKARENADAQRLQIDAHLAEIEKIHKQRETEVAMARKERAGMQRDVSDLQSEIQRFKAQQQLNERANLPRSTSNSYVVDQSQDDKQAEADSLMARFRAAYASDSNRSPGDSIYAADTGTMSPLGNRLQRDKESQELRAKLAAAHRKAGKGAAEKRRIREKNAELKKLLAQAGVKIPQGIDDDAESSEDEELQWLDESAPSSPSVHQKVSKLQAGKWGGAVKQPSLMAKRFGISTSNSTDSIDSLDAAEETVETDRTIGDAGADSSSPSVSVDNSMVEADTSSDSPRGSLDGIDPAFADVMKPGFGTPGLKQPKTSGQKPSRTLAGGSPLARTSTLPESDDSETEVDSRSTSRAASRWVGGGGRPTSTVYEPSALGNELQGLSMSDFGPLESEHEQELYSVAEESMYELDEQPQQAQVQAADPPKSVEEQGTMTDPLPDLVTPALQRKQEEHVEVIGELRAQHALALAEKVSQHTKALVTIQQEHQKAMAELQEAHDQALVGKDRAHAATIASTLADRTKIHEAALVEARSRHSKAMTEQIALSSASLAEAVAKHKTLTEDRDRSGKEERARREASHSFSLSQKDRQHRDVIRALESGHASELALVTSSHNKVLAAKDDALRKSNVEIEKLRTTIKSLQDQLTSLQQNVSVMRHVRDATEQQLKDTKSALAVAEEKAKQQEKDRQVEKAKLAAAASAGAVATASSAKAATASPAADIDSAAETDTETYQDAVSDMIRRTKAIGSNPSNKPSRRESSSSEEEAGVPVTPRDTEDEAGVKTIVLANLKESSCQTDDLIWSQFQDSLTRSRASETGQPTSSLTVSTRTDGPTATATDGGIMVLGGHRSNRPRDSVSTFGGNREGSVRVESPAPTMYTVGAITGHRNRRGSTDSTWSRQTDKTSEVPPVPPLPDKTRPPVMSVPPPPSMPPPASISVKRTSTAAGSAITASNNMLPPQAPPPRPTSPPPSELVSRIQRSGGHLQVPANGEQSRSVSRASQRSGPPPSAFVNIPRVRQQSSGGGSVRLRTHSGETNGSMGQPSQIMDGSIYKGLGARRKSVSSRRSKAGPRLSSAASFVSDVTSEISRRFSLASSQASEAGDETFVVRGDGQQPDNRADAAGGLSEFGAAGTTDPLVIHAITQTMIGEYLFKYTRKSMGRGGHSDKRHKRYFWVHPYTKMMYWTISDPGGANVSEGTSKSALIEGVRVVDDSNPSPPGLYHESLMIQTATREVKITAPSRERHEAWLGALEYLVNRPTMQDATIMASTTSPMLFNGGGGGGTISNNAENVPPPQPVGRRSRTSGSATQSKFLSPQRSFLTRKSMDNLNQMETTPRQRGGSVGACSVMYPSISKRKDIPAREWLQQYERGSMSPTNSIRRGHTPTPSSQHRCHGSSTGHMDADDSYDQAVPVPRLPSDPRLKTAEQMLEEDEPEDWDGLDNVRACCNGRHDVGSLAHEHGGGGGSHSIRKVSRHKHHHHGRQSSGGSRFSTLNLKSKLDAAVRAAEDRDQMQRPISPHPPQLPLNLPPRESIDSFSGQNEGTAASIFSTASEGPVRPTKNENCSVSQPNTVGPSYGERIQKIRQARQSTGFVTK